MKLKEKISAICKFIFIMLGVAVCTNINAGRVSASSAEVSINASSDQIVKGDIVYVIITVSSSDSMSGFEGTFSYDSRVLQYMTGGGVTNGNDDQFQISDTGRETGVNRLKYSVKFVARKSGNTSIGLKQPYAIYNAEDSSKMSVSSDSLNLVVKGSDQKKAGQNTNDGKTKIDKKNKADNVADEQKNKDSKKDDTDEKNSASPKPSPSKKNKKKSSQTTKSGSTDTGVTATYQNSVITIHYNDEYKVTELKDEKEIPTGFGKTEIVISGHVVRAYATEGDTEHTYVLIYCKKGRQDPEFYLYDTKNNSFMPYEKVKAWYKGSLGNAVVGTDSISETKVKTMKYIVGIMVIICLLMVIGMITIYLHYRQNNNIIGLYDDIIDNTEHKDGLMRSENSDEAENADVSEYDKKETENIPSYDIYLSEAENSADGQNEAEKESIKAGPIEEKNNSITHYWKRE